MRVKKLSKPLDFWIVEQEVSLSTRTTQKKEGFKVKKLNKPLRALNVDGTKNKRGIITSFVELNAQINGKIGRASCRERV